MMVLVVSGRAVLYKQAYFGAYFGFLGAPGSMNKARVWVSKYGVSFISRSVDYSNGSQTVSCWPRGELAEVSNGWTQCHSQVDRDTWEAVCQGLGHRSGIKLPVSHGWFDSIFSNTLSLSLSFSASVSIYIYIYTYMHA